MKTKGESTESPIPRNAGGATPVTQNVSEVERDSRLLVSQCQAVVNRISLREGVDTPPLTVAASLQEHFWNLERGLETGRVWDIRPPLINLYVVSVWLADQYGVGLKQAYQVAGLHVALEQVVESRSSRRAERNIEEETSRLRKNFQVIAYNVGVYELGYASTRTEAVESLPRAIPEFHIALLDLADRFEVGICKGVRLALRGNPLSELSSAGYNPLNTSSVRHFSSIRDNTYCPFAKAARLWGSQDFDPSISLRENLLHSLNTLLSFTRAARWEYLDGFVYAFPADLYGRSIGDISTLLKTLLDFLMEHDPDDPRALDPRQVTESDWRFRFNGEEFFVPVFAPLYPHDHNRYTYNIQDTVFILLQPDSSFHYWLNNNKQQTRQQIKRRFAEAIQSYDTSDLLEAHRFLLPTGKWDRPVQWYDAKALK